MLGPEGVVGLVMGMLQVQMPLKLTEMRTRLTLTGPQLPDIKSYRPVTVGKIAAGDYPALYVIATGVPLLKSTAKAVTGVQYAGTYNLTVVSLVRSTSFTFTTGLQQRTALAVRECLLQSMQLRPIDGTDAVRIDPQTIRERFSGIESLAGRDTSTYGGCMTDVAVTAQEFLPRLPLPLGLFVVAPVTTRLP